MTIPENPTCYISGEPIPQARAEFLAECGIPPHLWTSVKVAEQTVRRKQAAVINEDGDFMICSKIRDASIIEDDNESEEDDKIEEDDHEESDKEPAKRK